MSITTTIDREAGDSGKGFRLQLIRAIVLMLDTTKQDSNAIFFTAVENVGDVSHQTLEKDELTKYLEEDKNYNLKSNFTIFSSPVLNTLVSFFDIYNNDFQRSHSMNLGFYSTRNIGKERKSKLDDGEGISLPELPVLELLKNMSTVDDSTIDLVKAILMIEYKTQYSDPSNTGHLAALQQMTNAEFRQFLERINWFFGQEDETELKKTVLNNIEASPLYNNAHIGKENIIFCLLMEKLGEFQGNDNLVSRLVHSSDVKLIFKEVESLATDAATDPTWRQLTEIEVLDKRNLQEKVSSVIEDISDQRTRLLARKASTSKYEEIEGDKTFLSLKYRVLAACEDHMESKEFKAPINMEQLDSARDALLRKALEDIKLLKTDYHYSVSNTVAIEGIIWNLFDGCFLAFDEHQL